MVGNTAGATPPLLPITIRLLATGRTALIIANSQIQILLANRPHGPNYCKQPNTDIILHTNSSRISQIQICQIAAGLAKYRYAK